MIIANPIYDVVFKYLLSDSKIAKLLIGAIIGEDIEELEFKPTECRSRIEERNLLVYRLDFSATIKQKDGSSKLILIEIQKAKLPSDIMRFRRYLSNQYADDNNVLREKQTEYNPIPIITIYFLGHKLDNTDAPIIQVKRDYINLTNGKKIEERERFIEALTHDSYIIQIPYLTGKRKSELEQLLGIFDQSNAIENRHFLDIKEEDYPTRYQPVIRKLINAASEPAVRETMQVEDEVLNDLQSMERKIIDKDKALQHKDKVIQKALAILIESGMTEEDARKKIGAE